MTAQQIKLLWSSFPSIGQIPSAVDRLWKVLDVIKQAELAAANPPGPSHPSKTEVQNDKLNDNASESGLKQVKHTLHCIVPDIIVLWGQRLDHHLVISAIYQVVLVEVTQAEHVPS